MIIMVGIPVVLIALLSLPPAIGQSIREATVAATAWQGRYYQNTDLKGRPAATRRDPVVTFEWGEGPPFEDWPADQFSARWTRIDTFEDRIYVFSARSDDGVRMYVDGELIIDLWQPGSHDWSAVEREMKAGKHRILIEYFEDSGPAFIQAGYYPRDDE